MNYENNEDLQWTIDANCSMVNLVSTSFETESGSDYVTIAGDRFEGSDPIRITVPDSTIVHFHSDDAETKAGFVLDWTCAEGNSKYSPYI